MDANTAKAIVPTPTRRRLLATTVCAVAAGGTYVSALSRGVSAAVSADTLSVEDDSYAAPDGQLYSPRLRVETSWRFDGADAAARVMCALLIDDGLVTTEFVDVSGPSDSGTLALAGNVVDSRAWESADWQPPTDGSVSNDIAVELRLEVRDAERDTIVKASAEDTATITVSDAGPTTTATIGGDGSVSFLPSETATPTE